LSIESDSRNGLQPFRDNLADSLRAEELSISNDSSTAASEIDTNHEETGTTDPLDASKKDN